MLYETFSRLAVAVSWLACTVSANNSPAGNFSYNSREFLLNGEPYQIIGGQMDPQRIPPQYWRQRLQMARAMGLNTIFSYIFWNNIEPTQGSWDFTGRNDVAQFFRIAQEEGLHVSLRPGPYVCGEHEWGGFPAWLSQIPGMAVRQNNKPFLQASKKYIDRLGQELRGLQVTRGGPILMVQLENEYGSFGDDKTYLAATAKMLRDSFDVFLYTNDGGGESYLSGGTLSGVLAEVDGSPQDGFAARDKYVTDSTMLGPLLDGEYYVTWFDAWASNYTYESDSGDPQATKGVVTDLDYILSGNNSISIYMFHGGTNWGFENGGILIDGVLNAVTTSYDYGAALDESGRPSELYHTIRDTISKYVPKGSIPEIPQVPSLVNISEFALRPASGLFQTLAQRPTATGQSPETMEALSQNYGFILYEHTVTADVEGVIAPGDSPRDRVLVYHNGKRVGVVDATYASPARVEVTLKRGDTLQLLVEGLGRVDYNQALKDQAKGVVGNITVNGQVLAGWSMFTLPLEDISARSISGKRFTQVRNGDTPIFYTGHFRSPKMSGSGINGDTFLTIPSGVKGVVWVNGINMGRYWMIGPQQSLYVPGCYMKGGNGVNEVVVLELEPDEGMKLVAHGQATRQWFNRADPDAPASQQ